MNLTLRALAAGAGLTALGAVVVTACPALARELGVDLWDSPDWRTRLTESERRACELVRQEERVVRRTAVRAEIVDDFLSARVGAGDAVGRFVDLNRTEPATLRWVAVRYPGRTDRERAGWQLVGHLRARGTPQARALADELAGGLARGTAR